jgi:hypothetical protein
VFWVESVGGFVGFGLLGFSTQWAAFYLFFFEFIWFWDMIINKLWSKK